VFAGHVVFIDPDGVSIVAFDQLLSVNGHSSDPVVFESRSLPRIVTLSARSSTAQAGVAGHRQPIRTGDPAEPAPGNLTELPGHRWALGGRH
jgi:hypothetical protein